MTTDTLANSDLLDDYVAHWNGRAGETQPVGIHRNSHRAYVLANRFVTEDMIRTFAICHGDANPLWRHHDYANASVWGRIIGPPLQMLSLSAATRLPPPPPIKGWLMMQAGSGYEINRPLVPGDVCSAEDVWIGMVERSKPDRPHRTFILTSERRFFDQDGKPVGKIIQNAFATAPRDLDAAPAMPVSTRERPRYTDARLAEIYDHYDAENAGKLRRGAEVRYWEDVAVGDDIGKIIKGPVDILDAASFLATLGGGVGFAEKWKLIKDEIDLSPRDPVTNAYHFNMAWHLDDGCARAMGQPYAINFGNLIETNFSHALSNWSGDNGFVRFMDNKILAPMYLGETVYISGAVSKVYEEEGRGLVEIQMTAVQNDGIAVGSQRAVVQLPHKGRPTEVVDQVLPR